MSGPAELGLWQTQLMEVLRGDAAQGDESSVAPPRPAARREVLAFDLGGETYGIGIGDVAEILMPRPITPLPRAPAFVRGVLSLRGTVLPVIDLGRRLGLAAAGEGRSSRILVLRDAEERVGFWVEKVRGVVRFGAGDVQTTDFSSAVDPRFLEGIGYDRRGDLVAVLRSEALVDFRLEGP
jgi:purine-binding chemotaxis protein CheW